MAEAGPSAPAPMAPPGFQKASDVYRTQPTASSSTPSAGANAVPGASMRNASGGLPPIPKPSPAASNHTTAETSAQAGGAADPSAAPKKPINRPASSKNAIVYNAVQRRNPVLQSIKNVGLEIGDIAADYQVGTHNGVLFLSLKYHRLHPEYIHQRIEKMRNMYRVRILLVLCDVNEHQVSLREISKIAIINNLTVFVAWSNEEVAQYLTTFKAYEHKSDDTLKEPIHQSYMEQFQHVMTSGKKVNKTDSENLAAQFGSFKNISKQSSKVLSSVKGLGASKVTSLIDAFNKPFLVGGLKREPADGTDSPANKRMRTDGPGAEDGGVAAASPEWPEILDDEPEDDDADDGDAEPSRGKERVPSRSPGAASNGRAADESREGTTRGASPLAAWQDPLDDEDDDGDAVDDSDDSVAGQTARNLKA